MLAAVVPATLERVWIVWLVTILLLTALTPGGGDAMHHPGVVMAICLPLLVLQTIMLVAAPRLPERRRRLLRVLLACTGTPLSFTAIGSLLPAVHPGACEWHWLALDRAVLGFDLTVWLQRCLSPGIIELLQWTYAAFYLVPIAAALLVLRQRGAAAFDRSMLILVFGFLLSYLGYLIWPTLGPSFMLDHGAPLRGVFLAEQLHQAIEDAEANRWDCFPSGHTMLGLVSLTLVWRWARRWFPAFLPIVLLLVFSTMALRYHWTADVFAGALATLPAIWLGDFLLDLDGNEPA